MIRITATAMLLLAAWTSPTEADPLQDAVAGEHRSSEARLRDEYRHPQQTLRFFDIQPNMTVVEISPGGGWYTDILAPLLKDEGALYAAHFHVDENSSDYFRQSRERFAQRIETDPVYQAVKLTSFDPAHALDFAPAGTVDRVLTFRNVHNWYMRHGDEGIERVFAAFFKALKPGGILGVVEHRLAEDQPDEWQQRSGYMKTSYVVKMAQQAGFEILASSEVNANPLDQHNHPKGVWTLPPRLMLEDTDRDKYLAIGESDRMTLKFVKP
ncbi:methyltransferase [Aestuariibacter halophilus]|uniref:Methyltransferase n=1 Tax=Fluctibacter halophilus TaxID=226011 RepID=A0ABS8G979_9ALTE|nr:methyltransferase [Aestuariibacter halophilus]MCC2617068.1 methyltransferase [Aestuariibacter halophilus]